MYSTTQLIIFFLAYHRLHGNLHYRGSDYRGSTVFNFVVLDSYLQTKLLTLCCSDFGFERAVGMTQCIRNKSLAYNPYAVPQWCKPGLFYNRTKGYLKIQGDSCVNGRTRHFTADLLPCPYEYVLHKILCLKIILLKY